MVASRRLQAPIAAIGTLLLVVFLVVHVAKDLRADVSAWYFHSTPLWLLVMGIATLIYLKERSALDRSGVDVDTRFKTLHPSRLWSSVGTRATNSSGPYPDRVSSAT